MNFKPKVLILLELDGEISGILIFSLQKLIVELSHEKSFNYC